MLTSFCLPFCSSLHLPRWSCCRRGRGPFGICGLGWRYVGTLRFRQYEWSFCVSLRVPPQMTPTHCKLVQGCHFFSDGLLPASFSSGLSFLVVTFLVDHILLLAQYVPKLGLLRLLREIFVDILTQTSGHVRKFPCRMASDQVAFIGKPTAA